MKSLNSDLLTPCCIFFAAFCQLFHYFDVKMGGKIATLKQMHLEDLKAQTIAQKAAFASFRTSIENTKSHEIELLNQAHQNSLELAKQEVEHAYYLEMDNLKQENETEMMVVRIELERAIEISQSKEREFEMNDH